MEAIEVSAEDAGQRLDQWLAAQVGTRSKAQRMVKMGLVLVDGKVAQAAKIPVALGQQISFELPPSLPERAVAVEHPLDVVYEDESIILVNKPRGVVTHPSPGHNEDSLVNYLLHHTELTKQGGIRPGIVHRIDKDTSGLLVIAKNDEAQELLAEQFREHSIERRYLALVWGEMVQPLGMIDQPIGRHPKERKKFAVRQGGKRAVTHWRRIKSYRKLTLIECRLETGRTHQIRVHLAHLGHPLVGDPLYGRYRDLSRIYGSEIISALKSFKGQALHATSLGLIHPATSEEVYFEVPPPEELAHLIRLLDEDNGEG
ncbi:MAG: RluA family pseudouridine synthase [bacterium]|nr:RluA family pseudouridine synthase [bacterium]